MTTYFFDRTPHSGVLELTDQHRLDLLHRMSTNDVNVLQSGEGCSTVLTTALARIIDRVTVYHRGETVLLLTALPDAVRAWLQKHIFWADKVKVRDVSASWAHVELYGAQAAALIGEIVPGAETLPLHHNRESGGLLAAPTYLLAGAGYRLLIPQETADDLRTRLVNDSRITLGNSETYERLRIAAGMPAAGHELTEDYIPLEAGLWESVSFRKGCYIGQEIIARMESRNKLAKTLVALQLTEYAPLKATIAHDGMAVGTLTSLAQMEDGTYRGLGFVKPEWSASGTRLTLENVPVEVVPAPLIAPRETV
ncbi:MAG TPA: hypothetical protein PLD47_08685 [Aggregatilineales bacterium]|nr:glycine cleavage system protein T [Anaerolineales bacterium]HRE47788.1 hypothetical protein [Aggregatilineales bacterium]